MRFEAADIKCGTSSTQLTSSRGTQWHACRGLHVLATQRSECTRRQWVVKSTNTRSQVFDQTLTPGPQRAPTCTDRDCKHMHEGAASALRPMYLPKAEQASNLEGNTGMPFQGKRLWHPAGAHSCQHPLLAGACCKLLPTMDYSTQGHNRLMR